MIDEANFSFGKIQIFDDFVISEINEGVTVDIKELREILNYCENKFDGRPYGYISKRVHSYSVNPIVYMKVVPEFRLGAIAIVTQSKNGHINAQIESHFYTGPFKVFQADQDAKSWIKSTIN